MTTAHPLTIAVCSTKGGVGKTTMTVGLASALEAAGRRVLVVDLDPNGDSSMALGIDPMEEQARPGAFELLIRRKPVPVRALPPTDDGEMGKPANIWILPGDERLVGEAVVSLYQSTLRAMLPGVVDSAGAAFDAVVIDCPTAPRPLIHQGLYAADAVIHVLDAHLFAVRKVRTLLDRVDQEIRDGLPVARRHAVVANKINRSRRRDRRLLEILPEQFPDHEVFVMGQHEALARATMEGLPVMRLAEGSDAGVSLGRVAAWAAAEPTPAITEPPLATAVAVGA